MMIYHKTPRFLRSLPGLLMSGCAAAILITGGCSEKQPSPQAEAAPHLYHGMVNHLSQYVDSMVAAKDSAAVERLMNNALSNLTKLNFSYPANTDLELEEGQNDTIYMLTVKLTELRDAKLKKFGAAPSDSLATDSLATKETSPAKIKK